MNNLPGVTKLPRLFETVQWGRFRVKNRIKYGACCVSNYNTRDGFITEREVARTRVIAATGCGIITNQGAYPDPRGEGKAYFRQIALFDDKFLPQFERIAGFIHEAGGIAIQQILADNRFCGDCGAALSGTRPQTEVAQTAISRALIEREAERRQLTVLFCDLVGSTALSTRLDPEDYRAVIAAYNKCVAQVIAGHQGVIARYAGDGVLVYFGYPTAHEDDTDQAVRAGLELISAVAKLQDNVDAPLQARVGIATGTVVVLRE